MIVPIVWTFFKTTGTIRTIPTIIWKPGLRPNYQLWEHCITKRKKKKIKFVMHRVKIFLSSSLFSFYQGMVRTMKMSFFRKKNILSRYTQILVEFPRLMASSSEWTHLKPLLRESSLLTSGFTRIIVYIKADRTLTRFRSGKKMGKYGVERHKKITWTLFPSPQTTA